MRWLAVTMVVSSFVYAGETQEDKSDCLQMVPKLGTEVPRRMIEPFKDGERPHKGEILAWEDEQSYKVVRVVSGEPNIIGRYHIQHDYDKKTCVSPVVLYKILKKQKSRL